MRKNGFGALRNTVATRIFIFVFSLSFCIREIAVCNSSAFFSIWILLLYIILLIGGVLRRN